MTSLLAQCGTFFSEQPSLLLMFFVGGLAGSLTHCLFMCAPLIACQSACGKSCASKKTGLLPYHVSRLLMYGAFGFAANTLSHSLIHSNFWPIASSLMLACAGILFLFSALNNHPHQQKTSFFSGIFMSFMPCGLLYAAILTAATIPNPWLAMLAMWCFALGTMPALLATNSFIRAAANRWQTLVRRIGRISMACNGIILLLTATYFMR
jgi:uncharacterized protein